jgi:hypothetical protein
LQSTIWIGGPLSLDPPSELVSAALVVAVVLVEVVAADVELIDSLALLDDDDIEPLSPTPVVSPESALPVVGPLVSSPHPPSTTATDSAKMRPCMIPIWGHARISVNVFVHNRRATMQLVKYPRTRHLEGSRLQPGDHDLEAVTLAELAGRHLVVEEKLDGANAGISFAADGTLHLQSRGHFLTGGYRERHFDLLKTWAACHTEALHAVLGDRYVLYGEWVYAKHTVFYDALPHYFHEFDVLDRQREVFLDTPSRRALLAGTPVVSVPVLREGEVRTASALADLVAPSLYKTPTWRDALREAAAHSDVDPDRAALETDPTDDAEGLYVKAEQGGVVTGRYKFVRASFLTVVVDSGSHWIDRPIIPNRLKDGVDLFAP